MSEDVIIKGIMESGKYKLLYSIEEAAELLDTRPDKVTQMITDGHLNFYKNPFNTKKKQIPITEIVGHISDNIRGRRERD